MIAGSASPELKFFLLLIEDILLNMNNLFNLLTYPFLVYKINTNNKSDNKLNKMKKKYKNYNKY